MKRYAVFAFNDYYPVGGWDDLLGWYESIEEARLGGQNFLEKSWRDVMYMVDLETGKAIPGFGSTTAFQKRP